VRTACRQKRKGGRKKGQQARGGADGENSDSSKKVGAYAALPSGEVKEGVWKGRSHPARGGVLSCDPGRATLKVKGSITKSTVRGNGREEYQASKKKGFIFEATKAY